MTYTEKNELIAIKIMKWHKDEFGGWREADGTLRWPVEDFTPFDDETAAFLAVEEFGDCLHLKQHGEEGRWQAEFCGASYDSDTGKTYYGHGNCAAEAITNAMVILYENGVLS